MSEYLLAEAHEEKFGKKHFTPLSVSQETTPMNTLHKKQLEAFAVQEPSLELIYKEGIQEYVQHLITNNELTDPFGKESRVNNIIGCMDEGCQGECGIRLPGSGILAGNNWDESVRKTAEVALSSGATGITSHEGCGAVTLYCKQQGLLEGKTAEEQKDIVELTAKKFAQEVADFVHKNYPKHEGFNCAHIPAEQMQRGSFHDATIIWVSNSNFNPTSPHFPKGLYVDNKYTQDNVVKSYLHIATSIVFGEHGMPILSQEKPLVIVAIGGDDISASELENKLKPEVNKLSEQYGNRIILQSLEPRKLPIKNGPYSL